MAKNKKEQAKDVKLVKMENEDGLKADVHPDMVDEYAKGGYKEVK